MGTVADATTFRLILRGEGVKVTGEWFGFYAARQVEAPTLEDAATAALSALRLDWEGPSRHLGDLGPCRVVTSWRRGLLGRSKLVNAGHTFFNDDIDAQRAALRVEAQAASVPRSTVRSLLDDLA